MHRGKLILWILLFNWEWGELKKKWDELKNFDTKKGKKKEKKMDDDNRNGNGWTKLRYYCNWITKNCQLTIKAFLGNLVL